MRKISVLGTDVEAVMSIDGEPTLEVIQRVSAVLHKRIEFALTFEMYRLFETMMKTVDTEHPADFYLRPSGALEHIFVAFSSGWNQFLDTYFGHIPEVLVARKVDAIDLFDRWKLTPEITLLGHRFPEPLAEKIEELRGALVDEVLADGHYKVRLPPIWKELLFNVFTQGWNACRTAMGGRG